MYKLKLIAPSTTDKIEEAFIFNFNEREFIDLKHLAEQYTFANAFTEEVIISSNKPVYEPLATYPFVEFTPNDERDKRVTVNVTQITCIEDYETYATIYFNSVVLEVVETYEEVLKKIRP